jgi:hypothetical protein
MVDTTVVVPVGNDESSAASAVSWPAIIAGAVAAAAISFILLLLGAGFGLAVANPWTMTGSTAAAIGVGTIIWLIVTQWIAAAFGGYLTGRLRTRWVSVHTDEVFFRDTANGFLAWALATIVSAAVLVGAAATIVGGAGAAATSVASSAVEGAAQGATQSGIGSPMTYFADALFRPAAGPANAAPAAAAGTTPATGTEAAAGAAPTQPAPAASTGPSATPAGTQAAQDVRGESERILVQSLAAGEINPADRTYLAGLVAAQTGLAQAEAEKRVDDVMAQVNAAKTKATEAADAARKAGATLSLFTFAALLIGAFIAAVAAALGGRERDENESLYATR